MFKLLITNFIRIYKSRIYFYIQYFYIFIPIRIFVLIRNLYFTGLSVELFLQPGELPLLDLRPAELNQSFRLKYYLRF